MMRRSTESYAPGPRAVARILLALTGVAPVFAAEEPSHDSLPSPSVSLADEGQAAFPLRLDLEPERITAEPLALMLHRRAGAAWRAG